MPKVVRSVSTKISNFIRDFPNETFSSDNNVLYFATFNHYLLSLRRWFFSPRFASEGVRHRFPTGVPGNHLKIDYSSKNRFHEKYSAVSNSTDYHIKPIVSHIICSRTAMADLF